jgi:putative FmdB family regulatory protein
VHFRSFDTLGETVPTYVYRCQQCGSTIERRQTFQDPPLTTCESCQGELRRVMQPVGIIFKGSGFYTTDYKGGGNKAVAGNDGASTSESGSSSSDDSKSSSSKTSESRTSESKSSESKSSESRTSDSSSSTSSTDKPS